MTHGTSLGIKARPLDFFVAFLVFFIGFYNFLDPNWPEKFGGSPLYWIILIEDIYLVIASVFIMTALTVMQIPFFKRRPKQIAHALVWEMFGWLFIATASFVIAISTPWVPPSVFAGESGPLLWIWAALWLGLALSAAVRYWDIRALTRGKW